jgi:hypothetical protein
VRSDYEVTKRNRAWQVPRSRSKAVSGAKVTRIAGTPY